MVAISEKFRRRWERERKRRETEELELFAALLLVLLGGGKELGRPAAQP